MKKKWSPSSWNSSKLCTWAYKCHYSAKYWGARGLPAPHPPVPAEFFMKSNIIGKNTIPENLSFVALELVVGSGEQDIETDF